LPPKVILKEKIESQLEFVVKIFDAIDDLEENQYFRHLYI
jgi:hypothetical protein